MKNEEKIEQINNRYDNEVVEELKKISEKYQDTINILKNVEGLEDVEKLKKEIIEKKKNVDIDLKKINELKNDLLKNAKTEDNK